MKINATTHPVLINGKKINKPSEYLSADGLEVVATKNPIVVNGQKESNPTWYMSAEGLDVTTTTHPIVVNGQKESNPSWYMSADGKDDFYGAEGSRDFFDADGGEDFYVADGTNSYKKGGDEFYDADGEDFYSINGRNQDEVRAFQIFANSKGANLVVDGLFYRADGKESNTQKAYKIYGAEWEASRGGTLTSSTASSSQPSAPTQQPTASQIEDAKKKGLVWDKVKNTWIKAKESGLLDQIGQWFGLSEPAPAPTGIQDASQKTGMSRGTKTALIIGGVVVAGFLIYQVTKKRK